MATVFLDGKFLPLDDARVSAFDAGLQHGVGLFETMLATRAPGEGVLGVRVLHLREHMNRLAESCRGLALTQTLHVAALEEAVERTCSRAFEEMPSAPRLRVRLTITGGDLNLLAAARGEARPEQTPTLLIAAHPATAYPPEMFARGVIATVADWRVNPFDPTQSHKTLNYWPRLRELQTAAAKGAAESLLFSVTNHLAGGCVSNAFIVQGGALHTPIARGEEDEVAAGGDRNRTYDPAEPAAPAARVLPSPVLPGIVRRWVMDWALSEGLEVRRRMITVAEVLEAEEVLLTNSSWGVLPIVQVEGKRLGEAGPVGRRLAEAWRELTQGGDEP